MKILICSDSHSRSITKLDLDNYDYIIHCGDISSNDLDYFSLYPNLIFVKGNCDLGNYPLVRIEDIAKKKFFITHSHLYQTKDGCDILVKNTMNRYDIVCFGHTHIQAYFKVENTIYINPGAFKNNEYAYIEDNTLYFIKDNQVIKSEFLC